jgi:hypothetical protein
MWRENMQWSAWLQDKETDENTSETAAAPR